MRRALSALAAALLAALACGCSPDFHALTTPPPFATAELCDRGEGCGGDRHVTLTKGVALAFECTSSHDDPCTGVTATVGDDTVAQVFAGYLDTLSPGTNDGEAGTLGSQPRSALVVVGKRVGHTTLSISTDGAGDADFDVDVVAF